MRRSKSISWINFLVFLSTSFLTPWIAHGDQIYQPTHLAAKLEVNKCKLSNTDTICFRVKIKNISKNIIRIQNLRNPYSVEYIKIYTEDGDELKPIMTVMVDTKLPERKDYIELNPNEEITKNFIGEIQIGKKYEHGNNKPIDGLFLDFKFSSIFIPKSGIYSVIFQFNETQEGAEFYQKEFNFDHVWYGMVISNPVIIHIN